jgi:phosphoribosylglycinamide formyltransferase 1
MNHIAIFASGSGTNAQAIAEYFRYHHSIKISLILSNKPDAYVITRAKDLNIPCVVFNREQFYNTNEIFETLEQYDINFIVLAGFLWLMPDNILNRFENKIINIHPALLPLYGGKGMYGMHVHNAVLANHEMETGISIHFVNREYDKGKIIFQAKCPITPFDNAEMIATKVHRLEHQYFPEIIEKVVLGKPI